MRQTSSMTNYKISSISILLLIVLSMNSAKLHAKPEDREQTRVDVQSTPKIGLVLSGGGAKGSAHIGVLKVLEQHRVKIDYIAGTSIGAYIAGMYALGYSADEIEEKMMNTPWDNGFSDTIPREDLHYEEKQQKDQFNIPVQIGYSDNQLKAPSGILIGQTMSQLLRSSTDLVAEFESFDHLAIPYRAVAADLATSLPVVLDKGSLVNAMQASATVPGALQPMILDGKMLVDGGLANNMPVDVVKAMGADIVIAVDIGSSLASKEQIKTTVDVLNQLSTFLTSATTERQKQLLTDKDILIRPDVGLLSTTDWSIMPQALALGTKAALNYELQFSKLGSSPQIFDQYLAYKSQKRQEFTTPLSQPVTRIVYKNNSTVSEAILSNAFAVELDKPISQNQLKKAVARVYALDKFEHVDTEFTDDEQGRTLILKTRAKSWGPNYFKLGFSLQETFTLDTVLQLDLAYVLTDITENGGSLTNELTIGFEKKLATEFYQPLGKNHDFFARARMQWAKNRWSGSNQNELADELVKSAYDTNLSLGYNLNDYAIIEAGFVGEIGEIGYKNLDTPSPDYKSFGSFLHFGFDNLNSINFPTEGNQILIDIALRNDHYQTDFFGIDQDQTLQFNADWRGALSFGQHTVVGIASYAKVSGDGLYSVHVSQLGGFLNLSAFQKHELVGSQKAFGALVYQYDLGKDIFGLDGRPVYLGTSLETGNVWLIKESANLDDLIVNGSLFLGTDTALGPAAFGIGIGDDGNNSVFLSIGKNW